MLSAVLGLGAGVVAEIALQQINSFSKRGAERELAEKPFVQVLLFAGAILLAGSLQQKAFAHVGFFWLIAAALLGFYWRALADAWFDLRR